MEEEEDKRKYYICFGRTGVQEYLEVLNMTGEEYLRRITEDETERKEAPDDNSLLKFYTGKYDSELEAYRNCGKTLEAVKEYFTESGVEKFEKLIENEIRELEMRKEIKRGDKEMSGKKIKNDFEIDVFKDGKTGKLELVNDGGKNYSLYAVYPDNQKVKMKIQPGKEEGFPDIKYLAVKNGYEIKEVSENYTMNIFPWRDNEGYKNHNINLLQADNVGDLFNKLHKMELERDIGEGGVDYNIEILRNKKKVVSFWMGEYMKRGVEVEGLKYSMVGGRDKKENNKLFYVGIKEGEFKLVESGSPLSLRDIMKDKIFNFDCRYGITDSVFCGGGRNDREYALMEGLEKLSDLERKGFIDGKEYRKYVNQGINLLKKEDIAEMSCYGVLETNKDVRDEVKGEVKTAWRVFIRDGERESITKYERRRPSGEVDYLLENVKEGKDGRFKNSIYIFKEDFNFNSAENFLNCWDKEIERGNKNIKTEKRVTGRKR